MHILPPQAFVAYTFAGVPLLLWARRPYPREWCAAGCAALLIATWYCSSQASVTTGVLFAGLALGSGAASIVVAAFAAARSEGESRHIALRDLAALSAMPCLLFAGFLTVTALSGITPRTFDGLLTAADRSLGFNPSFVAGRVLRWTPTTWALGQFAYDVLPALLLAICAVRRRRFGEFDNANLLHALFIAGAIAALCYAVLPACGPLYQWGRRFPALPPTRAQLSLVASPRPNQYFRNALPSIHMVGAILVFCGTSRLGRGWRIAAAVNVALTVLVTMGTGEHYAVDLIAAVPTAVAACALADQAAGWRHRFTIGLLCLSFWIVLLRLGAAWLIDTPGLTWLSATVVVGAALFGSRPTSARRQSLDDWLRDSTDPASPELG